MTATRSERSVSFWLPADAQADRPSDRPSRPSLSGTDEADVCIVGAGFTGLWTAYYLAAADPTLRIVVVEAEHVGYGASGRNGGWLSGAPVGHPAVLARRGGEAAVRALQAELDATVTEVERVCGSERIDAELRRGGTLRVARTPAQVRRLRDGMPGAARWGLDLTWLDAEQTAQRIAVAGALGSTYYPHCASVHPGRLVLGLAEAVQARGVCVYEGSPVTDVSDHLVRTAAGQVRSATTILATEGYTCSLPGHRRRLLPMNSSMIITDPVPPEVMDTLGWRHGETLGDAAHVYVYGQRTTDDRIALGGRGVPYRFGSGLGQARPTPARTVAGLTRTLVDLFPALADVGVADSWSGVLGVPRDWTASVGLDRDTGLAHAGGYTGHGVAATNLAGRTLADLVLRRDTPLTRLPWVDRRSPGWEPEPFRWLGVRGLYAAYRLADRLESRPGAGPSRVARIADLISRKP